MYRLPPSGQRTHNFYRSISAIMLLSASAFVTSCNNYEQGGGNDGKSLAVLTTPLPTMTLSGHELDATKSAILQESQSDQLTRTARATSFAQGTAYPFTPIVIPTSEPVNTPALGINGACADANREFDYGGCWAGQVGGEYVFVDSGAPKSDRSQGMVRVYTATLDLGSIGDKQEYLTPNKAGKITIASATWPYLTLVAIAASPPITYTFDLLTRQWVSPTPGPSPSVSASPIPSTSPLPTQQP